MMKKKASTEIRTQVKRVRVSSANRYTIEAYLKFIGNHKFILILEIFY